MLSGALKTPPRAVKLQLLRAGRKSTFIVEGANTVSSTSCVHQSLETCRATDRPTRHWRKNPCRRQRHIEKLWIPLAPYLGWKDTSAHRGDNTGVQILADVSVALFVVKNQKPRGLQDLRVVRLPTSTRVHCATHALFQQAIVPQIRSVLTCKPFFLLVRELHKYSKHWYSMGVRTADVVRRKSALAFRLCLIV